jgi:hypothetical protein
MGGQNARFVGLRAGLGFMQFPQVRGRANPTYAIHLLSGIA